DDRPPEVVGLGVLGTHTDIHDFHLLITSFKLWRLEEFAQRHHLSICRLKRNFVWKISPSLKGFYRRIYYQSGY
ncbi:MAG: hypothetical protein AB1700_04125, partial [Bacillota bacterium]